MQVGIKHEHNKLQINLKAMKAERFTRRMPREGAPQEQFKIVVSLKNGGYLFKKAPFSEMVHFVASYRMEALFNGYKSAAIYNMSRGGKIHMTL